MRRNMKDRILEELQSIAFSMATDYLIAKDNSLTVRNTEELPQGAGAAIASIERSSTGLKVKFYDKLKALELLGKCCGLFDGGLEQGLDNGLLEAVLQATGGCEDDEIQETQ